MESRIGALAQPAAGEDAQPGQSIENILQDIRKRRHEKQSKAAELRARISDIRANPSAEEEQADPRPASHSGGTPVSQQSFTCNPAGDRLPNSRKRRPRTSDRAPPGANPPGACPAANPGGASGLLRSESVPTFKHIPSAAASPVLGGRHARCSSPTRSSCWCTTDRPTCNKT